MSGRRATLTGSACAYPLLAGAGNPSVTASEQGRAQRRIPAARRGSGNVAYGRPTPWRRSWGAQVLLIEAQPVDGVRLVVAPGAPGLGLPAAGRTSTIGVPRRAPGRLQRPGGEGGWGGAAPPAGAEPPHPECYSPLPAPPQQRSPNPGAERTGYPSPEGGAEAGPPLPRRDRSPTSPPPRGSRGGGGLGGGVVRRSRRSVFQSGAERTGSAAMSATHPTCLETPTKESNACASQGLV
ncbi:uncharacterized protein LOC142857591 [Microtus pennsylvanicus]|uniref:uncharacterized protein LOC142857591 n=1 Tax=Microtus pennsylvanicus TaxID=10058 RepID=UPI003F6A8A46